MTQPEPTHTCPGNCGAQVPHHHLACKPCWWRLPAPLRNALNAAHRKGGPAHRAALQAALRWYAANPARGDDG